MSNKPIISVIVPVYGVEKYIAKCLLSIQQQTFKDFECIVVDDGSPDDSAEIGKKAVEGDERFIFVSKPNGGLASARNFGLDHAKGEYIAFVDSDDWVEPDFLELPYDAIIREDADVCMLGINYVDEEGKSELLVNNLVRDYYEKNDFLISDHTVTQFAWSKLYKKEIWDEIRFSEEIITYEDVYVTFRLLYGKKIVNVKKPLYNYLQRAGTLSRDIKPTYLQDRVAITKKQAEFVKNNNLEKKYADYILYTYLKTFIFYCSVKFARYSKNYNSDIRKLKKEIDYNRFILKNILFMIKKEKKVGLSLLLFKLSPTAFRAFARFWFRNHAA